MQRIIHTCRYLLLLFLVIVGSMINAQDLQETLNQKVSPSFIETPLEQVLRTLSRQYKLNLVVGDKVAGNVTLQMSDIPLRDALTAILSSSGYAYIIQNNILLVKPADQLISGDLNHQVYNLRYIDAALIRDAATRLLSAQGQLEIIPSESSGEETTARSNKIVVSDLPGNLAKIGRLIDELDVPQPQVMIEVRLVETTIGDEKSVGIDLPKSVTLKTTGAETTLPGSSEGSTEQDPITAWTELPSVPDFEVGILTVQEMAITLEALQREDNARLVSKPKVYTLNDHRAMIRIGTNLPVQEVSRSASGDLISFEEKQVSLNLEVIPRINEKDIITLYVHPALEEIIGYTGPAEAPQPITSLREVETNIQLKNGETVVIGGLIKETNTENVEKVWLLGSIPLLGYFFRHTRTQKTKSDLLIFITTQIL